MLAQKLGGLRFKPLPRHPHLGALMDIFFAALGSCMRLALLVWVGGGLIMRVLYFFGNEPS